MIYCLIPAKPYVNAKSRLSLVLTASQRATLSCWLLQRTVRLARAATEHVVVISRDRMLLTHAKAAGAWGLLEVSPGLNPALGQAARFAEARGASGLLILPTDLPRLAVRDLETILALGAGAGQAVKGDRPARPAPAPAVVIAPCRHGTGTNALLVRPPHLIPFAFGPDSFAVHCAAARTAGVEPLIYRANRTAFDLDTPEDWSLQLADWNMERG